MKKALLASITLVASASTAFAGGTFGFTKPTDVPEISALEGTAALAVVATVVLLAWERRRRAS